MYLIFNQNNCPFHAIIRLLCPSILWFLSVFADAIGLLNVTIHASFPIFLPFPLHPIFDCLKLLRPRHLAFSLCFSSSCLLPATSPLRCLKALSLSVIAVATIYRSPIDGFFELLYQQFLFQSSVDNL